MNLFWRAFAKVFLMLVPKRSARLYHLFTAYTNRYDGINLDDMHTNGEFRLLRELLPRCKTVFDIGANVGDWTAFALGINPALTIHCFEPSRSTFADLAQRRFPASVVRNNLGLSDQVGQADLFLFESQHAGLNSLYQRSGLETEWGLAPQATHETVSLTTFDAYYHAQGLTTPVDFLKIDVEGHELRVLQGMRDALAS